MADTITTPPPSQLSSLPLRDHAADALPRYQTLIDTAASLDDGWFQRSFPAFRRFHRKRADRDDAVEVDIRYAHASQLNDRESDAVFSMTKANMQHLCAHSSHTHTQATPRRRLPLSSTTTSSTSFSLQLRRM